MAVPDYLSKPDPHLSPEIAAVYDAAHASRFAAEEVEPAVDFLVELAEGGPAVEFAVGTGRLALPLSKRLDTVHGLDFSTAMLDELRKKEGVDRLSLTVGDMTSTRVCDDASLVFLAFNTITNLRTQQQQVECFANAADHLKSGGRFVIEVGVPKLQGLPAGESIRPFDVSPNHLGFDEYIDRVNQISISHHYFVDGDQVRTSSPSFRYAWPSELDLMAQLAGMTLENRYANWQKDGFTGDSPTHVSVWLKP